MASQQTHARWAFFWLSCALLLLVFYLRKGSEAKAQSETEIQEKLIALETRIALAEKTAKEVGRPYDCLIWVRSKSQDVAIPNASIWVVDLRATFITDQYGRVPIFRRDAHVVVNAPGFKEFEERIEGCGDEHHVYLESRQLPVPKKLVLPGSEATERRSWKAEVDCAMGTSLDTCAEPR